MRFAAAVAAEGVGTRPWTRPRRIWMGRVMGPSRDGGGTAVWVGWRHGRGRCDAAVGEWSQLADQGEKGMPNFAFLDVAIGLFFVYLIVALLASAIAELVEMVLRARARFLRRSITELLGGSEDAVKTFYEHPAIDSLFWGKYGDGRSCDPRRRLPSYIPPRNFAIALIGGVLDASRSGGNAGTANGRGTTAKVGTTEELRDAVGRSGDAAGRMLRAVVNVAGDDMEKVLAGVERLFEAAQERVTGRFKRYTTGILFVIGMFLAYFINVDTIELVKYLAGDAAVRNALIEGAGRYVGAVESEDLVALARELQGLSVAPLGTPVESRGGGLLGLVLTSCAISLGGPFWYDLLGKLVPVRGALKPKGGEDGKGGTAG